MALIACSECGKDISSRAVACPHCGCPNTPFETSPPAAMVAVPDAAPMAPTDLIVVAAEVAQVLEAPPPEAPSLQAPAVTSPKLPWETTPPHPWRRWSARITDNIAMGLLVMFCLGLALSLLLGPPAATKVLEHELLNNQLTATMITLAMVVVPLAFLVGATGTTLGKYLFGVRVVTPHGRPIGFKRALVRELTIYAQGLALGIPLVNLITMGIAHKELTETGRAPWDNPETTVVTYRALGFWTILRMLLGIVLLVLLIAVSAVMARMGSNP